MSGLPVAHYLEELGRGSELSKVSLAASERNAAAVPASGEARIEEVRALAYAEGRAAERAACDARLAEQSAAFAQRLAAERRTWTSEEGERLGALIVSAVGDFEARIGDKLAGILKPVLVAEVKRRAVAELVDALDGLLSKGEIAMISISGPEDLLEALRPRLAGRIAGVSFAPGTGCDVSVTADETKLETRIGDWARAIEGLEP
jgi:hypothetical protein